MKLAAILYILVHCVAFGQNVYIPDTALKAKLIAVNQGIDINADGEIQITEALSVTDTIYANNSNITDLTGIGAFANITGLNVSSNNIQTFDCENLQLKYLDIKNNDLTHLGVSNCSVLTHLNCYDNDLSAIDISTNLLLSVLYCGTNNLSTLNISNNTDLETLYCATNNLNELDISQNTKLKHLYCFENNITALNFSATPLLELLSCGYNPTLASLDFSNTPLLVQLNCINTAIQSLNLSMCHDLRLLICNGCDHLTNINLKNDYNYLFSTVNFNFSNLVALQSVCVDDPISNFSLWLQDQVNSNVAISNVCFLSVDENTQEEISVYPNPTVDMIYITGGDITEIYVYNYVGQQIEYHKNVRDLDFSKFTAGLYLLHIEQASGSTTVKKILKK